MLTGKKMYLNVCFQARMLRVGLFAEATDIFCLHFTDLDGKLS